MFIHKFLKTAKNKIFKEFSTDIALRYKPVVRLIKKYSLVNSVILEVGSGDTGLTTYLPKKITGVDIAFNDEIINHFLNKVKIDGRIMPFSDSQFDVAVSVDNLEHVARPSRKDFLKEVIRVTKRYLIIVVPCGGLAEEQDGILNEYFLKIHNRYDNFLAEHITFGLPGATDIAGIINSLNECSDKKARIILEKKLTNLKLRGFYMRRKIAKSLLGKIIYFAFLTLLPFSRLMDFGHCYRRLYLIKID